MTPGHMQTRKIVHFYILFNSFNYFLLFLTFQTHFSKNFFLFFSAFRFIFLDKFMPRHTTKGPGIFTLPPSLGAPPHIFKSSFSLLQSFSLVSSLKHQKTHLIVELEDCRLLSRLLTEHSLLLHPSHFRPPWTS